MQRLAFIDFCCEFAWQLFAPADVVFRLFLKFLFLFFPFYLVCSVLQLKCSCYRIEKSHSEQMENYTQTHPFDLDFNERVKWIYTRKQNAKWNERINCTPFPFVWCVCFFPSIDDTNHFDVKMKPAVICSTSIKTISMGIKSIDFLIEECI